VETDEVSETTNLLARVWETVDGPADLISGVQMQGPTMVLPSVFDVTGAAAAMVGAATLAAAEVLAVRSGAAVRPVTIDRRCASAAFQAEVLFTPIGWRRQRGWDPIAGIYRSATGFIRLHTNYPYHREAVERVLAATDKEAVAAAVASWDGEDLEATIVARGGCAAVMHDRADWLASTPGRAGAAETLVARTTVAAEAPELTWTTGAVGRPYEGVRVLDLTRVIAGPVCTKFLAGYGADVLRIDPPGFAEVPALLPETMAGKRSAHLDLTTARDRTQFEDLLRDAHILVTGLRADALDGLGYDAARLRALNPTLIMASLNAYGWQGPWRTRRGFDSLVQMSCGIAAAGASAAGTDEPRPLPAAALDYGTGYLLAAAVGRALATLLTDGVASDLRCSLIATANLLMDQIAPMSLSDTTAPRWTDADTEPTSTGWGPARRVPLPGAIAGVPSELTVDAAPLGHGPARWLPLNETN
jgi:CoA transferase family III